MMVHLFKKYKRIIAYLFWGVVTTVVNILSFQVLHGNLKINYVIANIIAWILAVLVAFFSNKVWVFGSHYTTVRNFISEFLKFCFYRLLTLVIDMLIMFVGISLIKIHGTLNLMLLKLIDNIIVTITNYVFSKWLIFVELN
ncbi:GtrA family protein [Ligilactobacillus sp. LYQ60]|uniref:GtrA family protein n=1 Tax=unclassified Ligilactobacillus TaxID=2767920 RepID=UPI00385218C7